MKFYIDLYSLMKTNNLWSIWLMLVIILSSTFVLSSCSDEDEDDSSQNIIHEQHEAVDLGLPSGIKWATMNVGATKPEEYGDYFAWGETKPYYVAGHSQDNPCSNWETKKTGYFWESYQWCNGSFDTLTKYCRKNGYGRVDGKMVLDPEDDAAHVSWGGDWRMPTQEELYELREKCTWTWTTLDGISGYKVKGPNGKSIFLPAAGSRSGPTLYDVSEWGDYWSASLCLDDPSNAYSFSFWSDHLFLDGNYRYCGCSVRAVCP